MTEPANERWDNWAGNLGCDAARIDAARLQDTGGYKLTADPF